MTWFEFFQLLMNAVPAILAILGGVLVAHKSYRDLQNTVATLVAAVEELKPQADLIATMQRDIERIKRDIETIRKWQQDAAFGRPQKGELEELSSEKVEPRPPKPPKSTELEDRVDDLEDGVIDKLRIHKVDDPPEGDE